MRRIILPALALLAATIGGFHEWTPPAHATTSSCSNTLLGDGHGGPWRTHANGGTLHGNTLHISCPSGSTHWSVRYQIQIVNQGQVADVVFSTTLSGDGAPNDQSFSLSPYPCDPFGYRTHVDNLVTGGNVNMPSGGGSVNVGC